MVCCEQQTEKRPSRFLVLKELETLRQNVKHLVYITNGCYLKVICYHITVLRYYGIAVSELLNQTFN